MTSEFDQYSEQGYDAGMDNQLKSILSGGGDKKTFQLGKISHLFDLLKNNQVLTIYDFGCGDGEMLECLFELFPHHTLSGSDVSTGMIELAKKRFQNQKKKFFYPFHNLASFHSPIIVKILF